MNERHDDLQEIIDAALREMAAEEGDGFDPQTCNLAEFCRRTGLTRSRARTVDWQHLFGRFREGQPRLPELDRRHVAQRRVDPEVVVPVHVVRELGP